MYHESRETGTRTRQCYSAAAYNSPLIVSHTRAYDMPLPAAKPGRWRIVLVAADGNAVWRAAWVMACAVRGNSARSGVSVVGAIVAAKILAKLSRSVVVAFGDGGRSILLGAVLLLVPLCDLRARRARTQP